METTSTHQAVIAPMIYLSDVAEAINFYQTAFNAEIHWQIPNSQGGVHVAELKIFDAIFRLHEFTSQHPEEKAAGTIELGLLVADPDAFEKKAQAAGAKILSPLKDYEYGYRQGTIADPFGIQWCLEQFDGNTKVPI